MAASIPVVIASNQGALSITANSSVNLAQIGGTNTVTGGIAGTQGVGGPTAGDAAVAANPVTVGARASTAVPTAVSTDGDVVNLWASLNGALNVILRDTAGTYVSSTGGTQYVGDAAATATPTTTIAGALANAAAPVDVSANNDAVALWALRNGSLVTNLASGGTLITVGSKVSASSIPVVIASDQGAIAVTPAANSSVNVNQIVGAAPSATNPLPVRLADGAAFYTAASQAPTDPKISTQTSAALGAGASATVNHYVTSGKTGRLAGVDVASTVPLKIEIQTKLTGTPTTRVVLFAEPFVGIQWRAPYPTYITRASADATSGFSVTITNKDASLAADVYSTAYFDEV